MTRAVTASLRSRDHLLIIAGLGGVVAVAWAYLYSLARDMTNLEGSWMSGNYAWSARDFLLMFIMWGVMMVGMMVPTALRAVLIYAGVARQAEVRGTRLATTGWFASGYILIWTGFSLGATILQGGLNQLGLLSPMMVSSSPLLGAGILLAAGIYQLTPWKDVCLRHCQAPALYLAGKFKPGAAGAVTLGIRHGGYCLGCCWLLMCLLFLGGVMNLVWIAAITAFVLMEKLLPASWRIARMSGLAMVGSAVIYLLIAERI